MCISKIYIKKENTSNKPLCSGKANAFSLRFESGGLNREE